MLNQLALLPHETQAAENDANAHFKPSDLVLSGLHILTISTAMQAKHVMPFLGYPCIHAPASCHSQQLDTRLFALFRLEYQDSCS